MTDEFRSDRNAQTDEDFRREWRAWIASHYRSAIRGPLQRLVGREARDWLAAQHRDGWRAPSLDRRWGGMGLILRKQLIYQEELERFSAARPMDMGLRMLVPILLRYGSEGQKASLLPRILSAEDTWCQGYSEPGAGSDLASLRMQATEQPDGFIVRGQKAWTTMAQDSEKIFLLVRTGGGGRNKRTELSFLLADLASPGVTVRPVQTISGHAHFCEVFFDDVHVPRDGLVGSMGDGWSIGKALLGFERFSHGSPEVLRHAFAVLRRVHALLPADERLRTAQQLERHACDVADATALYAQACEELARGEGEPLDFSLLKLFNAETAQRIAEAAHEMAGPWGGLLGRPAHSGLQDELAWLYLVTRPLTIFGGTSQVQRNLLATGMLRLPRG